MALPPRGDPRRPLHLAIRSLRALGIVLLLFGTCTLVPMMMMMTRTGAGRGVVGPAWIMVLGSFFYAVPGALFVVFSVYLGRHRFWAVVGALIVSSVVGLFLLLGSVSVLVVVLTRTGAPRDTTPIAVVAVIFLLFVAAIGQLIYHLAKSFEAIKHPPFGQEFRGFEPIALQPAMPLPPQHQAGPGFIAPGPFPAPFPPAAPQPPPPPADSRDTHGPAPGR